jgi:abortive infection alpha-like protein
MDPETTKKLIETGEQIFPEAYKDIVQPAAKVFGQELEVIAKAVGIALAPLHVLVWGYERIGVFIEQKVSEKLQNVPAKHIVSPVLTVAGPLIEALRFAGDDEVLRELYANILANAMDSMTSNLAHPAFIEILKNLSSDEALLLKAFIQTNSFPIIDIQISDEGQQGYVPAIASFGIFHKGLGMRNENLLPNYLENLCRLGLLEIPETLHLQAEELYKPLIEDPYITEAQQKLMTNFNKISKIKKRMVGITYFGNQFVNIVVKDKH